MTAGVLVNLRNDLGIKSNELERVNNEKPQSTGAVDSQLCRDGHLIPSAFWVR